MRHHGALPDLFREGHSVVAEGFLRPLPSPSLALSSTTDSPHTPTSTDPSANQPRSSSAPSSAPSSFLGSTLTGKVASAEARALESRAPLVHSLDESRSDVTERAMELGLFFAATEVLAKHDEVRAVVELEQSKVHFGFDLNND